MRRPLIYHLLLSILKFTLGLTPFIGLILYLFLQTTIIKQVKIFRDDFVGVELLADHYVENIISKDQDGVYIVDYKIIPDKPDSWVSIFDVSHELLAAIVVSEDARFHEHFGIDLNQIDKVLSKEFTDENLKEIRGASTIHQQIIKNLFLSHQRSFKRKGIEVILATYLDGVVGKDKVLETYINIVEFGDGIYGIKEAAKYYFNTTPKKLTAKQGAFLAMLLPSPKRYAISFKQKQLTPYASKIVGSIMYRMYQAGYIDWEKFKKEYYDRFDWERDEES